MKLINDIISEAVDESSSLAGLLRKCLVLADLLDNDELRNWASQELDGYPDRDLLPKYRVVHASAKGLFIGGFGSSISDQPIPSAILKPEHKHFAETVYLTQPIASYEMADFKTQSARIDWPANLVVLYQSKFFEGQYALNRAWQEIPSSSIVGLLDTVRNRILRFALEIKKQLGIVSDDPKSLPHEKVTQMVTNIIYGGQNVIGSQTRDVHQIGNIDIAKGDAEGLKNLLVSLGITEGEQAALVEAIAQDALTQNTGIGSHTTSWLATFAGRSLKVARELAIGMLISAISKYLGIG